MSNIVDKVIEKYDLLTVSEIAAAATAAGVKIGVVGTDTKKDTRRPNTAGDYVTIALNTNSPGIARYATGANKGDIIANSVYANYPFMMQAISNPASPAGGPTAPPETQIIATRSKPCVWQIENGSPIVTLSSNYEFIAPNVADNTKIKIIFVYNGAIDVQELTIKVKPAPTGPTTSPAPDTILINNIKFIEKIIPKLNTLISTPGYTKDDILDGLPNLTMSQELSVVIPLDSVPRLIPVFNNNRITYPNLAGITSPLYLATTKIINNVETLDMSKLPKAPYILVIPSLITDSKIIMGPLTVKRGNKSIDANNTKLLNQLTIDNGTTWININSSIIIGSYKFTLSGIGSPVVFTVTAINTPSTESKPITPYNKNPVTIWEYIFYFSYPVAFLGACSYGALGVTTVDPTTLLTNRSSSVSISTFIGISAVLSLYRWFGIQNPVLDSTRLDQNRIPTALFYGKEFKIQNLLKLW